VRRRDAGEGGRPVRVGAEVGTEEIGSGMDGFRDMEVLVGIVGLA
jgi:hypothetical protein